MNETVPSTEFQEAGRNGPLVQTGPFSHRTSTGPKNEIKKTFNHIKNWNGPPARTVIRGNWVNPKREIDPKMDPWSANACVDFVQHMLRLKPD